MVKGIRNKEDIWSRISEYDPRVLHARFDEARLRWELTKRIRTKDWRCQWQIFDDIKADFAPRLCDAPAKHLDTPVGDLCQEHFEAAAPEVHQAKPVTTFEYLTTVEEALFLRGRYEVASLVDLLKNMILFWVGDSHKFYLYLTPPWSGIGFSDGPGIECRSQYFHVVPLGDQGPKWRCAVALVEWVECMQQVGLIR